MIEEEHSCGIVPLKIENGITFVLLIAHKGGRHWGFPKGHKNPGESDIETAERELKEETGLSIERCLLEIPYVEMYKFYKFNKKIHKKVTYFPCFVQGDLKLQAEEIIDACWVSIEEADKKLTFPEAKEICKKVREIL